MARGPRKLIQIHFSSDFSHAWSYLIQKLENTNVPINRRLPGKEYKVTFCRDGNVFHVLSVLVVTVCEICQNSLKYKLKRVYFIICKLYLNKVYSNNIRVEKKNTLENNYLNPFILQMKNEDQGTLSSSVRQLEEVTQVGQKSHVLNPNLALSLCTCYIFTELQN